MPAGAAVHILLREAGDGDEPTQRGFDAFGKVRLAALDPLVAIEPVVDVLDVAPGVARQPLADERGGAPRVLDQREGRAELLLGEQRLGHQRVSCQLDLALLGQRADAIEQHLEPRHGPFRIGERRRGFDRPADEGAGDAQHRLGALEIAAEPEQVVGGARRQVAEDAPDLDRAFGRQQRCLRHRRVTEHPHVG